MRYRVTTYLLVFCVIGGLLCGCGNPGSKLVGQWVSSKDNTEVDIDRNGDAFMVEIRRNGQTSRFPGSYEDGRLTIQNMWVTVAFYHDDHTGELVANAGGAEDRMKRK